MNEQIELIQDAISNYKVLFLKYKNAQLIVSEREIEPLAIYYEQNEWKLVAFCKLRREKREFLIKRFQSIVVTEKQFPPNQFSLNDYFKSSL